MSSTSIIFAFSSRGCPGRSEVSGGGSRAFAYSMGVYRALHELRLIPQLDAISSAARPNGWSW